MPEVSIQFVRFGGRIKLFIELTDCTEGTAKNTPYIYKGVEEVFHKRFYFFFFEIGEAYDLSQTLGTDCMVLGYLVPNRMSGFFLQPFFNLPEMLTRDRYLLFDLRKLEFIRMAFFADFCSLIHVHQKSSMNFLN